MLLRQAQLDEIARQNEGLFKKRLARHVHENFARECEDLGPEGTELRLREAIETAKGYGFENADDIAHFVNLVFEMGPGFDRNPATPWVGAILEYPHMQPSDKVLRLYETLPPEPQEQADVGR